jgi:hypothetical protein
MEQQFLHSSASRNFNALDCLHLLWHGIEKSVASRLLRATDFVTARDGSQLLSTLVPGHENRLNTCKICWAPAVAGTVAPLAAADLKRIIEAKPLRAQRVANGEDELEISAMNLARVYCDVAGTLDLRCRRDPSLRTLYHGISGPVSYV